MNFNRLEKLNNLVINDLKRKPTIILDPDPEKTYRITGTAKELVIGIDADNWEIPEEIEQLVTELKKSNISLEEKILKLYQKLGEDYVYDDNVLSYIKKNDDETFSLTDYYGREVDSTWKENRKKHNRRNCFEISRMLAKALKEIIKVTGCEKKYDVCIFWDEINTHYFVGLACEEYYISLDLDDFTQIKDLTRIKTGLTLDGIKILEDQSNKFTILMNKINENRRKTAKEHIQSKIENIQEENTTAQRQEDVDDIRFLQYTVQILKEDYNLDSAGIFEYLKEIVDTKIGAKFRKKVWKEVENNPGTGTRYTRCLTVSINDTLYIIDVTKNNPSEIFRKLDEKEIEDPNSKIVKFKEMSREWSSDPYDGR